MTLSKEEEALQIKHMEESKDGISQEYYRVRHDLTSSSAYTKQIKYE